jgi:hypothetical protein
LSVIEEPYDADAVTEHTLIPVVAIFVFRIEIHPLELIVGFHMQRERIRLCDIAAVCSGVKVGHAALSPWAYTVSGRELSQKLTRSK